MKKLFILPLATVVLSACSSNEPAPVVSVGQGDIVNGEQYGGADEINSSWNDDVQQLPQEQSQNSINTPQFDHKFAIPRDRITGKPLYEQIKKGGYQGLQYRVQPGDSMFLISYISGQTIEEIARLNNLVAPYDLRVGQVLTLRQGSSQYVSTNVDKNSVHIPRDPQTNKPEYNKIAKGFYQGDSYTVKKGDTLYLVSYISGQNVEDLATLNNLQPPYDLNAGQVLRLNAAVKTSTSKRYEVVNNEQPKSKPATPSAPVKYLQNLQWQWPTKGKVIDYFSMKDGGNKGIDIAGRQGQSVKAAAGGQVVYAGNALQGYGNLIIIKHNNDYLSAYAHNHQILVKDKEWVKDGQEIATMGGTGTNNVKLHFEVRYKGQSVDPMKFLPKQ